MSTFDIQLSGKFIFFKEVIYPIAVVFLLLLILIVLIYYVNLKTKNLNTKYSENSTTINKLYLFLAAIAILCIYYLIIISD